MRLSLRKRVMVNFVLVLAIFGVLGGTAGTLFINRTTISEEQRRVGADLRAAWGVLEARERELAAVVGALVGGRRVAEAFGEGTEASRESLADLEAVRRRFSLDFLGMTDAEGRTILRTLPPHHTGDLLSNDPLVAGALRGKAQSGLVLLSQRRLLQEGGDLAERAFVVFEETPRAKPRPKASEDRGLALVASAPIEDRQGHRRGVLYAGLLLNRNHALVDQIRALTFANETMDGRPVGTVTIFQWDVRVATNVILANGNRALGTRVSAEVYDRVLENGQSWYDQAFVVNDWYISAYDPLKDVEGKVIGILYVGVLAKKYEDIRRSLWKIYGGMTVLVAGLVALIGFLFSGRLTRAVSRLSQASGRIAAGQLDHRVPEPRADDELRDLTRSFNSMAAALLEREESLGAARRKLEEANSSLAHINHNYLEMLGFISHELKNTLGVIYTSAATLSAGLAGPLNDKQRTLVAGIDRNIGAAVAMTRQYLDLTRIEKGELTVAREPLDLVGDVLEPVLGDLAAAAGQKGVRLEARLPASLPSRGDTALLKIVFKNLLDNALKYGRAGGEIRISHRREAAGERIEVWNQGPGLTPDQLEHLFDKFVRFASEPNGEPRGTGLGLFITRDLVRRHGGRIWGESDGQHWVRMVVVLPAGDDSAPPAAA